MNGSRQLFALLLITGPISSEACSASSGQPPSTSTVVPVGSAAPPASSTPPSHSDGAHEVLAAEKYSIRAWHLGQPLGLLASTCPDLWLRRRFDDEGDVLALTIGKRYWQEKDSFDGSQLEFIGPRPNTTFQMEREEEFFAPIVVIALGDKAAGVFTPPLPFGPAKADLGTVSFTLDIPLRDQKSYKRLKQAREDPTIDPAQRQRIDEELRKKEGAPRTMRIEQHASRVASVLADGRLIGYVLGAVPREPNDRFYDGLQQLARTHLDMR